MWTTAKVLFFAFLAFVVLTAGLAYRSGTDVQVNCGPTTSTPIGVKGINYAQRWGKFIKGMTDGDFTYKDTVNMVRGTMDVITLWNSAFNKEANGDLEHSAVTGWKNQTAENTAAALASCCVRIPLDDPPESGGGEENGPAPFDPKQLSFQTGAKLTGKYLAADALAKAGFPKAEIPTFVAIAKFESSFNAGAIGPRVGSGTMRGMWQMNDQYWKNPNWRDPYVNAKMAKKARDESVDRRSDPYYPWSTRESASRTAHLYDDLVGAMPSRPSGPGVEINPPTDSGEQPSFCPAVPGSGMGSTEESIKVTWPVAGRSTGTYAGHTGVDINRGSKNEDMGDRISAAAAGTVDYVGGGKGYGQSIWIKTDTGGYTNIYGHTSKITVVKGQHVNAGDKIGEVGDTGNSTAAHLHFEVRPGGTYKAAMDFLNGKAKGFEVGGSDVKLVSQPAGRGNPYSPRAAYIQKITKQKWGCAVKKAPCISAIGGYSNRNIAGTNTLSDHATGNADDIMVRNVPLGNQISKYMVANADVLNVKYVIWNRHIWSAAQKNRGWRPYHGTSNPHTDHVHVSVESGVAA